MTPLGALLAAQIAREGPMRLSDYMAACLHHPAHGYYATRETFGRAGDFTTAPEISQMFGELLGLALAQAWMDQGRPDPFILAELGPGRGFLMRDALRATARVPGFHAAQRLWLVEASPRLRAEQAQLLGDAAPRFADQLGDLPPGPLFLVANEFFDALPIRAFQRVAAGWAERLVGLTQGALAMGLGPPGPMAGFPDAPDDTVLETCAPAEAIAAEIGARIAQHGGLALIVDYGGLESTRSTFRAIRNHAFVDPFSAPGEIDLTADVAFGPILRAAQTAQGHGPLPQGAFLTRLGIDARAQTLARGLAGAALAEHLSAHRRLTHPAEMGNLFQVIGLTAPGAPVPPGLEPA